MDGHSTMKLFAQIVQWLVNGLALLGWMLLIVSLIVLVACGQRTFVMLWYHISKL